MSGPAGGEEFLELGVQFCRLGVHADVGFPYRFRHGFLLFWTVLRLRDLGWVLLPLNVQENSRVRYRGGWEIPPASLYEREALLFCLC